MRINRIVSITAALSLLLALCSCAMPGMTVDFASIHRINSSDAAAKKYGSVRETVTAGDYSYTVDTVWENGTLAVYETAGGGVTAVSSDFAYYVKDGKTTALIPCFQSYKDALAEYLTTVHPLDCGERWQRSAKTEDGVETVVYYQQITPVLEAGFAAYGLRDGAVLTMTYKLDPATSRFLSITYAEEYGGEVRTVCERVFEYGKGFEFRLPDAGGASVTVRGDEDESYIIPAGCSLGWLGTGVLWKNAERTEEYIPGTDFPEILYK